MELHPKNIKPVKQIRKDSRDMDYDKIKSPKYTELTKDSSKPSFRKLVEIASKAKSDSESVFGGIRMMPAGYDIQNLNEYNDPNHWHIKKSTQHQEDIDPKI